MEAVEFIKQRNRLCRAHRGCNDCPLFEDCCYPDTADLPQILRGKEEELVNIVEKWAKEHPAGEQHKTEERYIKLTPDSVEFVATAGKKTRSLKIVEQATEKYDSILAVLREYAPPDEIAYYLEHGETKGQMLQRIENSVTVEECGFEK